MRSHKRLILAPQKCKGVCGKPLNEASSPDGKLKLKPVSSIPNQNGPAVLALPVCLTSRPVGMTQKPAANAEFVLPIIIICRHLGRMTHNSLEYMAEVCSGENSKNRPTKTIIYCRNRWPHRFLLLLLLPI